MATNTPVARVAALQGQVFAQDEKGNLRQLKLDDPIYEGEVLVTGMGASVELAMQDGRTLNVPANETLTFDAEVAAQEKPDATDSALADAGKSAEKIIQAVKEGGSLDELLEETAAGNVGGDAGGGPTFVRLMRITESVDPLNFEFGTNRQGALDYPLEGGGRDTPPAPPTLTVNDVNGTISGQLTVAERGLRSASDADTSNIASGTLTINAPGGMTSLSVAGATFTAAQLTAGASASTTTGIFTITGYNPATGELSYTYTLTTPQNQPGADSSTTTLPIIVTSAGGTATGELVITILDDLPEAKDDANAVKEDAAQHTVTGNVFENDELGADKTATPITPATVTLAHGTLELNADGSYTYTLDNAAAQYLREGQQVTDAYTYTLTDADGDSTTAKLNLTITGTNDAPRISVEAGNANSGTTDEGNEALRLSGTLALADIDTADTVTVGKVGSVVVDGDAALTIPSTLTTDQLFDMLTVSGGLSSSEQSKADGIHWNFSANAGVFDFLPEGKTLTLTYTIQAQDDSGAATNTSNQQTITITITGTNDAPTAAADTNFVKEDSTTTATGNVIAGTVADGFGDASHSAQGGADKDPDSGETATLTVTGVAAGAPASASGNVNSAVIGTYGSVTINANGSYTYNLDHDKADSLKKDQEVTDTFTYTIRDAQGATSTSTLVITVIGTNDAPTITSTAHSGTVKESGVADGGNTAEAGTTSVSGTLTATDVDGDTLTWSLTGQDANNAYGTMVVNADGTWSYTLDNSLDATQKLTSGDSRTLTFTTTVSDSMGGSKTQDITITIEGTNDAPVITSAAQTGEVTESGIDASGNAVSGLTTVSGTVTASDVDQNDSKAWSLKGTLDTTYGTMVINASTGQWTYTLDDSKAQSLAAGDTKTLTFIALVTDSKGATAEQEITITIKGTNDGPTATADASSVTEDTSITSTGNVLTDGTADSDPDTGDTLTVSGVAAGTPGSTSSSGADTSVAGAYGSVIINANGSYTYTLNNGTNGVDSAVQKLAAGEKLTDTFTYTISDSKGGFAYSTLTVTINGTNDAPVISVKAGDSDSASLTEADAGLKASGTLSVYDVDTLDTVTPQVSAVSFQYNSADITPAMTSKWLTELGLDTTGTDADRTARLNTQLMTMMTVSGGELSNAAQSADQGIAWNFNSGTHAFNFLPKDAVLALVYDIQAKDNSGVAASNMSNVQQITLTITGTNDGLVVAGETSSTNEDTTLTGNVLTNDHDYDASATLSVTQFMIDGTENGGTHAASNTAIEIKADNGNVLGNLVLKADGTYTFTPAANYSGTIPQITYTVQSSDTNDAVTIKTATLDINVKPVADQAKLQGTGNTVVEEDNPGVALGFKLPEITDKTDLDDAVAGDYSERLGPIALRLCKLGGILEDYANFVGTKLLDGNGSTVFEVTNSNLEQLKDFDLHIRIVDTGSKPVEGYQHTDVGSDGWFVGSHGIRLELTQTQFESLKIVPVAQSGKNIRVQLQVNEYEVDVEGKPLTENGKPLAAWNEIYKDIDVKAVTDDFDLQIRQTNDSSDAMNYDTWLDQNDMAGNSGDTTKDNSTEKATFTIEEDTYLDLKPLLKTASNFADTDGSEHRWFTLTNDSDKAIIATAQWAQGGFGEKTILPNETFVIDGNNIKGASLGEVFTKDIKIKGGANLSGDFENITLKLYAHDTDPDSPSVGILHANGTYIAPELKDTVTFNLHVNPVAGDVKVDGVTTTEDTAVAFMEKFQLTDADGSEKVTALTIKGLPEGWKLFTDTTSTAAVLTENLENGVKTYSYTVGVPVDGLSSKAAIDTFFKDYTLRPPANSSLDATIKLVVNTSDEKLVDGTTQTVTATTELEQKITVTPVAEQVNTNTDGIEGDDLTMTSGHTYGAAVRGQEGQPFALNQDSFNLKAGWANADSASEQTFARLTPVLESGTNASDTVMGAVFTWTEGGTTHSRTFTGTPIDVPMASLNTLTFTAPPNVAGTFKIKVEAYTLDKDEDDNSKTNAAVSGEAWLSNIVIDPVATEASKLKLEGDSLAAGYEDQKIGLDIRPSSEDASETFNITIKDIPKGATIFYQGVEIQEAGLDTSKYKWETSSDDQTYSLTINNFSNQHNGGKSTFIQFPGNQDGWVDLKVTAVAVDSFGAVTSASGEATPFGIAVYAFGQADGVGLAANASPPTVTEAMLEASDSNKIALTNVLKMEQIDKDGSETTNITITGLKAGLSIEGMKFAGGVGTSRVWVGSLTEAQAASVLVDPEVLPNFSGKIHLDVTARTSEKRGDSMTENAAIDIIVTPSPEAKLGFSGKAVEDVEQKIDLVLTSADSDEKLHMLYIRQDSIDANKFSLYLKDAGGSITQLGEAETIGGNSYYKLTAEQAATLYAKGAANYSGKPTFSYRYEIIDSAQDSSGGTATSKAAEMSDQSYTLEIKPVTDSVTLSLGTVSTSTDSVTTTIPLTLSGQTDTDGSEKFTRIVIDNVPLNMVVKDAVCLGGAGDNWRWVLEVGNSFTSGSLSKDLVFTRVGNTIPENHNITITAFTQDSAEGLVASAVAQAKTWTPEKVVGSGGGGDTTIIRPAFSWEKIEGVALKEDTATTLGSLFKGEITTTGCEDSTISDTRWSINLTDLPEGSKVAGGTLMHIDGKEVWAISGKTAADLTNKLASVTITPPENWNQNNHSGALALKFDATLTLYDITSPWRDLRAVKEFSPSVTPVTDSISIGVSADGIKELSAAQILEGNKGAEIKINLSAPVDGSNAKVVGEKVYVRIDESEMSSKNGKLFNGDTELTVTETDPSGMPNGTYYVISSTTFGSEFTLHYQPAEQAKGTVSYSVYVTGQETGATNPITVHSDGSFKVTPITNDLTLSLPSDPVTGQEDANLIELTDIKATLADAGETLYSLKLTVGDPALTTQLLNDQKSAFTLWFGENEVSAEKAYELGDRTWSIPVTRNALPNYIGIKPPENWSGQVSIAVETWHGEAGQDAKQTTGAFTLEVTGVADGFRKFEPALAYGDEIGPVALNLRAAMKDGDGSETATIEISDKNSSGVGLGANATFYVKNGSGWTLLDANQVTYDATGGKHTISGLKPNQVNRLGVMQHDGTYELTSRAWTVETESSSSSEGTAAYKDFRVVINDVAGTTGNDTLLYHGETIDGGAGTDTAKLHYGTDLDTADYAKLKNVEVLDLGLGNHTLDNLSIEAVKGILNGSTATRLTIRGEAGDTVSLQGEWTASIETNATTYTSGSHSVQIDKAVEVRVVGTDGNDTLHYSGHEASVSGGGGADTLKLAGDLGLDLGDANTVSKLHSIERIDLAQGNHTITGLDPKDVLDISGDTKQLMILGDSSDKVKLAANHGFTQNGTQTETIDNVNHTFDVYTATHNNEALKLLLEQGIIKSENG